MSAPPTTRREDKFKKHRITDNFTSIAEIQAALRRNGVESVNLIVGVPDAHFIVFPHTKQ